MAEERRGRFAYDLDRLLHEKARLGIMTSLLAHPEGLAFTELRFLVDLTDGNLNRHLHALGEAGLIEVRKGFEGRRPQTLCLLTGEGRHRFLGYLEELEKVVRDAALQAGIRPGPGTAGIRPGPEERLAPPGPGEAGWAPA